MFTCHVYNVIGAVFKTLWRFLYTPIRFRERFRTSSAVWVLTSAGASVLIAILNWGRNIAHGWYNHCVAVCQLAEQQHCSSWLSQYITVVLRYGYEMIWTTKTQALHLVDQNHFISYMLFRGSSAKRLVNTGSARPFAGLPRLQCQLLRRYWSWRV